MGVKNHQITVVGPIAAGKTTASQLLARELSLPLLDADLYEENPFLPSYIEDTARWSFATELFFTTHRIKKLSVISKMLAKSSVIVDSGLIMSHEVYTKNHLVQGTMTAAEWDFFTAIVEDYKKNIPEPDVVVLLTASVETQQKRIASRGRGFESGYTPEYLQNITDRLEEYAASLENKPAVTRIPLSTEEFDLATPKGATELVKRVKSTL